MIRERGSSYQAIVYVGVDPVTGKRLYLRESTPDPREAESISIRLCAQVDDQRRAKSKATFRVAYEKWLRVAELAESTRENYERYATSTRCSVTNPPRRSAQRCLRSSTRSCGVVPNDAATVSPCSITAPLAAMSAGWSDTNDDLGGPAERTCTTVPPPAARLETALKLIGMRDGLRTVVGRLSPMARSPSSPKPRSSTPMSTGGWSRLGGWRAGTDARTRSISDPRDGRRML